jgi:hypothetical protein
MFLECGAKWELIYVRGLRRPPSLRMALGTAGHAAAEKDLTQKIDSHVDLELDAVLDAFADSYNKEAADSPDDNKGTWASYKDSGIAAMQVWHKDVAPTVQPTMVEEPVQFTINDIPYNGTVDLVDDKDRVRDWKFVGRKPGKGDQKYVLNMTGYAIGYRQKTGLIESGVILDHIVRTKTPYYFPVESTSPVPDESIIAFADIVEQAYGTIQKGAFAPNGIRNGTCSYCPFRGQECVYTR